MVVFTGDPPTCHRTRPEVPVPANPMRSGETARNSRNPKKGRPSPPTRGDGDANDSEPARSRPRPGSRTPREPVLRRSPDEPGASRGWSFAQPVRRSGSRTPPESGRSRSRRQALTAPGPAPGDRRLPGAGAHSQPEPVLALTLAVVGLEGALHPCLLTLRPGCGRRPSLENNDLANDGVVIAPEWGRANRRSLGRDRQATPTDALRPSQLSSSPQAATFPRPVDRSSDPVVREPRTRGSRTSRGPEPNENRSRSQQIRTA